MYQDLNDLREGRRKVVCLQEVVLSTYIQTDIV